MKLTLVHLYHDLMNVYGDRGNIITLERRCAWRGIELEVRGCTLGEELDPTETDLIFFGGGQDREQSVVAQDLVERKGPAIKAAVDAGAALLAVCGGFQLLGHGFRPGVGDELPGVGLFDAWTVAGERRFIGNVVIACDWAPDQPTLVGFENHSGRTYLGPDARPLGRVLQGFGNNGEDRREGAIYRNAYGCYLHGSLLPKNPWFADLLIASALEHRSRSKPTLAPLDDHLERMAHDSVVARTRQLGQIRSGVR
jgi:lipid II isoglutaminyl synthase (glutamine-hydrolysing)